MSTRPPYLSVLARVFITCLTLVGLGFTSHSLSPGQDVVAVRAVDPTPVDIVAFSLTRGRDPEVLAKLPLPAASSTPVPPPVPTAAPVATAVPVQEWAQALVDTPLRVAPEAGAVAEQFVPKQSYLKLLTTEAPRLRVFYGGNGDDHKSGEGWVDAGDIALTPAPRWVEARRGTPLWSGQSKNDLVGTVPEKGIAEVLEDRGPRLKLFYLGDGFSREQVEGWADATNLGPAGPLLVSERYGLKVLTRADVQSIEVGNGVWLRVPFRTQLDSSPSADANCGPSSVAMAMQFHRISVPTGDVRALADKLQGTTDPEGGFQIEFLAGAVERFGLRGWDLGLAPELLKRWTLDDVRRHLGDGHPVIAQLRFKAMPGRENASFGEDHYVVLVGMLGEDFIYNDSVDTDGPGYGRIMSAEDLKHAWGTSFAPFAGFAVSGR